MFHHRSAGHSGPPDLLRGTLWLCVPVVLMAARLPAQDSPLPHVGQFVEIGGQIGDRQVALVRNHMVRLAERSRQEHLPAVLVIRLLPGSSTTGNVTDLARVLTDEETSAVRTIAWIPERLTGRHVIVALACHEIILAPNAALGDIGRGRRVSADETAFIRQLVQRRRNPRLPAAVAMAMLDPDQGLVRVTLGNGGQETGVRFVSPAEHRRLVESGAEILSVTRVREPGQSTVFTAEEAVRLQFIVSRTAHSDEDVRHLWNLPVSVQRNARRIDSEVRVAVIAIRDMITPVVSDFVIRETHRAVREGANLLIYDIDSPGGFLLASEEIATEIAGLDPAEVTTVAWIEHEAISGAAVVALGCDRIVMTPSARIGDIGVITPGHDGAFDRVPEKLISPFLVTMEELAKKKDRPPALLQAMVDRNLKVYEVTHRETGRRSYMTQFEIDAAGGQWVQGPLVPESREEILLTLSGTRAHELGLADAPCESLAELRLRLGIDQDEQLEPRQASWVDTVVFFLNTQTGAFLLMSAAILCLYLEVHLPGGFFGIVSAAMFALFFWSRYLGGTAGSLELIMFLLGMGLLVLEIFVIPGFGVFGISGILLVVGSLVMASQTFSGMTAGERFHETMTGLGTLAGSLLTVIAAASILNYFLPSLPGIRHLILTPPGQIADSTQDHEGSGLPGDVYRPQAGDRGTAATMLRPAGKATFGDQFVDVVSEGSFIDPGTEIEVVHTAGNRIVVRKAETS